MYCIIPNVPSLPKGILEQDVVTPHLLTSQFTEIWIKVIHIIAILNNALPSYETLSLSHFLFLSDGEDIPDIK